MRISEEKINSMTEEEMKEELLDSMSDAVKDMAKKVALLKAVAKETNDIEAEDFDKAFQRELEKNYSRLKGKSGMELAIIGMGMMMASGADISDILGD